MRETILLIMMVVFGFYASAQVGIGTTTPATSSMLEISSTSDGGATYKGFMPPRVPTTVERDAINPSGADAGLVVYVIDRECLQMWNGTGWENIHCLNEIGFAGIFQNFDLNTAWGYTSDIPFFDNGADGYYGITTATNGGFSNITTMTNNFLGVLDMNDEGVNGTAGFATVTFDTIDISGSLSGVTLSFDYEFFEFDTGDDVFYTVTIDGTPQAEVQLINGIGDLSLDGTVSVSAPAGSISIALSFRIRQDGAGDYAGFDNFAIIPN